MNNQKLLILFLTFLVSSNFLIAQNANLIVSNELAETHDESVLIKKTKVNDTKLKSVESKSNLIINHNSPIYSNVIKYNIKKTGFVTIKLLDADGKEIASLIGREQKAGNHYTNFSAINLNSGIYYYQLSVDNITDSPKMIFVN